MSGKTTAIVGFSSAAAVTLLVKVWRDRRTNHTSLEPHDPEYRHFDIDDDTTAEIIKRARPALVRARALY
jgi:hypothetical protein